MQANRETPLAGRIQEKLDHQGFLTSEELNPFLCLAIENAMRQDGLKGILIDGFPRCEEQLNSWTVWPFQDRLRLVSRREASMQVHRLVVVNPNRRGMRSPMSYCCSM